jgi:hypothetical protein
LTFVLVFVGVAAASASALPGDALYPVKRGLESAQLALTLNPAARASLQAELSARRRAETQAVINLRRETQVEFEGVTATFIPTLARPTGASPIPSTPNGARPAQITPPTDIRPSLASTETRGPEATPTPGETRPAIEPTSTGTRAGRP